MSETKTGRQPDPSDEWDDGATLPSESAPEAARLPITAPLNQVRSEKDGERVTGDAVTAPLETVDTSAAIRADLEVSGAVTDELLDIASADLLPEDPGNDVTIRTAPRTPSRSDWGAEHEITHPRPGARQLPVAPPGEGRAVRTMVGLGAPDLSALLARAAASGDDEAKTPVSPVTGGGSAAVEDIVAQLSRTEPEQPAVSSRKRPLFDDTETQPRQKVPVPLGLQDTDRKLAAAAAGKDPRAKAAEPTRPDGAVAPRRSSPGLHFTANANLDATAPAPPPSAALEEARSPTLPPIGEPARPSRHRNTPPLASPSVQAPMPPARRAAKGPPGWLLVLLWVVAGLSVALAVYLYTR